MYVRTVKSGEREYVQLCHNYREGGSGPSRTKVLFSFGRKDQLDVDALRRLVSSISRYLDPAEAAEVRAAAGVEIGARFVGAKHLGGTHLLDGVWRRLGIGAGLEKLLAERGYRTPVERLLFALVANRALDPGSKLAVESWLEDEVHVDGLESVDVQQLYRAMDFLLKAHDDIQKEVFWSVSNLFNLEVDLLFIDTTTAYFEIDGEDDDEIVDAGGDEADHGAEAGDGVDDGAATTPGLRKRGHSKDSRPGLAQVVIGFAVTRDGLPVRCWVWPGNTADVNVVDEVKRDLNAWKLGRVIMVLDAGFNSERNRRILQGAGDAFILGERMRLGPDGKLPEALSRAGRYKTLANGLRIKEVTTNEGSVTSRRFVIVHNPEQEATDRSRRDDIVRETERRLESLKQLEGKNHSKAACDLRAHRTFGRFVKQAKSGALSIDKAKVAREAKLDGKFLVSTSDPYLSSEEIAMGYKQLHEIERVNRDLKHTVDVRPVYHRRADRIKAHVLLCWLALLLIRVIENESGSTWHQIKKAFRPLLVAQHATQMGIVSETNPLTSEQKRVLDALRVKPPQRYPNVPTIKTM
ncbi:MAG: IS1634 family transposase [Chloroflexi bacterium]|nr:IS1634 family transposase [Chloroflexota bacterium]